MATGGERTGTVASEDDCTELCVHHTDKVINFHCVIHDILGCLACITQNHSACKNVVYIPQMAHDLHNPLFIEVEKELQNLEEKSQNIDTLSTRRVTKLDQRSSYEKLKIQNFRRETNKKLNNIEAELEENLSSIKAEEMDEVVKITDQCLHTQAYLDQMISEVKRLKSSKQHCSLYMYMFNIKSKLQPMCSQFEDVEQELTAPGRRFSFDPNFDIIEIVNEPETFGNLTLEEHKNDKEPRALPNLPIDDKNRESQRSTSPDTMSLSNPNDIKLHRAEEAWKPSVLKKYKTESNDKENIYKKTRSILNKLTPEKFQTLVSQMQALPINTETQLRGVVGLVFEKAICEPKFSVAYANLCRCLSMFKVPSESKPREKVDFRAVLLTLCQREFKKDNSSETIFKEKRENIQKAEPGSKREELEQELEHEESKAKRRSLGNNRFIGELFKLKMLTENIMHDCVFELLRTKNPENLECLCRLLTTMGKELDVDKAKGVRSPLRYKNELSHQGTHIPRTHGPMDPQAAFADAVARARQIAAKINQPGQGGAGDGSNPAGGFQYDQKRNTEAAHVAAQAAARINQQLGVAGNNKPMSAMTPNDQMVITEEFKGVRPPLQYKNELSHQGMDPQAAFADAVARARQIAAKINQPGQGVAGDGSNPAGGFQYDQKRNTEAAQVAAQAAARINQQLGVAGNNKPMSAMTPNDQMVITEEFKGVRPPLRYKNELSHQGMDPQAAFADAEAGARQIAAKINQPGQGGAGDGSNPADGFQFRGSRKQQTNVGHDTK